MKAIYLFGSIPLLMLMGCQSMGDHYSCMAEVDRTVPAQTQQRYLRTDTKCVKSNEQTVTGAFGSTWGTVYNPAQGDVNCSSTPVYETIILNQAQRDVAYQQCRGRVNSQRNLSQSNTNNYPNWTGDSSKGWKDSDTFKPNANWSVENLCSAVKNNPSQKADAQKELNLRNEKCK